ncbi:MAG TPA: hypothetical protein VF070_09930 [Streptosporangiaceae bacterium]
MLLPAARWGYGGERETLKRGSRERLGTGCRGTRPGRLVVAVMSRLGAVGAERRGRLVRGLFI